MHYVNFERYLRHLRLLSLLSLQLVLLFHSFVRICLSSLMFSLGADSHRLKHKTLKLEHVERVVLFDGHFVFADVLKQLLHEWVVRVFNNIVKIILHDFK